MTLSEATEILRGAGIEDAALDARLIFAHFTGMAPSRLIFEDPTANGETERAVMRRADREPLAYILGQADFYRERYKVSEACLVPRQETELLVDYAVKSIPRGERFADLCTGSGCIAVSVLKNTEGTSAVAADISEAALDLARENAAMNGVGDRVDFVLADVRERAVADGVFAVLSNPPYVRDSVYATLPPEIMHEPRIAFLGGEDGADFYRRTVELYRDKIKPNGFILFEIGYDQGEILRQIAEERGLSCEIMKDYSGLDRMALMRKN